MTLNEICKALECCSTECDTEKYDMCDECPYHKYEKELIGSCIQQMCNDAIELIKKQRAEIELLTKRDEKAIGEEAVKKFSEQLIERTKGILLDDETLVEIIDELLRSK